MLHVDIANDMIIVEGPDGDVTHSLGSPEAFNLLSSVWLRSSWIAKYAYNFSWLGRPIIQLPEDLIRLQEVIYSLKPDVIIETGVAHGGSLIFYASLMKAIGKGRVIGVDIEIRPHNRSAIEGHELFDAITLIEGSSTDPRIVAEVKQAIRPGETVLVILDSDHSKQHVMGELEAYSELVTAGSYIVATDGIMGDLAGVPRSQSDWTWNNPREAAADFVANHGDFDFSEPSIPFNQGLEADRITYWPGAWIRKAQASEYRN